MAPSYALFGQLVQTRGLQGHVVAQLATAIKTLDPVTFIHIQVGHTYVPYQVEEKALSQPNQAVFKLQGINDKSTAQEIVTQDIWFPSSLLNKITVKPALQDQVVGYHVTDVKVGELGIVKRIEVFPMHRCLVVDYKHQELLIPYISALIKDLDPAHERLIIHLPTGFLEAMGY